MLRVVRSQFSHDLIYLFSLLYIFNPYKDDPFGPVTEQLSVGIRERFKFVGHSFDSHRKKSKENFSSSFLLNKRGKLVSSFE